MSGTSPDSMSCAAPRMMRRSSRSSASALRVPRRTARMYVSWWTTSANGWSSSSTSRAWQFMYSPGGWVLNSWLTIGRVSDSFGLLTETPALPTVHISYRYVVEDHKHPFGGSDTTTGQPRHGLRLFAQRKRI